MKKILIWDVIGTGHHIEYLTYLYIMALGDKKNKYIFVINENTKRKGKADWKRTENIEIIIYNQINRIKQKAKLLSCIIKYSPQIIFLNQITEIISPVTIFLVKIKKIVIQGIIYRIYLYEWKNESIFRKIKDIILHTILQFRIFETVYILNDSISSKLLNKIWECNKYKNLIDPSPIANIDLSKKEKVLEKESNKIVITHCGSLARRKGTIDILRAMLYIGYDKNIRTYCFVGKVCEEIKEDFKELIEQNKNLHEIIIEDTFVTYSRLYEYIKISDYILLPYSNTSQSSGIIAYAAEAGTKVVVPAKGLLKNIVRKYNLGFCIDLKPKEMANFIATAPKYKKDKSEDYLKAHSHINFIKTIKNSLTQNEL